MSYPDDDDLLAALGRAVGPDPDARPSAAERDALRSVVLRAAAGEAPVPAADDDADDRDDRATVVPITSARRLRNRLLVGGAAVLIGLSGTTAVAAAVNDGALPGPVRAVVHAVGLPVDSVEVAQAKAALKQLRTATDADLADALARAERELADLSPSERAALGDDAGRTLAEARVRLAAVQAAAGTGGTTSTPSTSAPTTPPTATTPPTVPSTPPTSGPSTATSVDDRGGDRTGSDDSTPGATDGRGGSGTGGSGTDDSTPGSTDDRGGGSDDSTASTAPSGSTATTDDSSSGKGGGGGGGGGDSTVATTPSGSTETTDGSGSGRNRGGGGSGGGTDG